MVTRRDFLDATLLASGAALLTGATPRDLLADPRADFDGYGGIGDYARANGNTWDVLVEGHKIRDRAHARVPAASIDDGGRFDCVIVGGGISGLAAALFFQRRAPAGRTCLVLENHAMFGGLARQNEFQVGSDRLVANQASAMFFPPLPGTFLAEFYPSIGIDRSTFPYQTWGGTAAELPLGRTPYFAGGPTSAFYFGARFGQTPGRLFIDPLGTRLDGAPISERARRDLLTVAANHDARRKAQPRQHGDDAARRLDSITLEEHLMALYGIERETVRNFMSPVTGGGSGLGADALSAYADYAADVLLPWQYDQGSQMFPGGNAGVARHLVRSVIPDAIAGPNTMTAVAEGRVNWRALDRKGQTTRLRLGATVVAVQHDGPTASADSVSIVYSQKGRLYRARARAVIVAGGSWTSKHIVQDLPDAHRAAYAEFHRSPCLVANVALRNWRFLHQQGIHECRWFEGLGNYAAVRKVATFGPVPATISPDSPVVLTLKILFSYPGLPIGEQIARGRAELLGTSFAEYERRIREQLSAVFGSAGLDARRDIVGLVLNRWGHAYLSPQPGFFFGLNGKPAPGEVLRQSPFGRIAFANSDVTGIMDHRASIIEADRAVTQIL